MSPFDDDSRPATSHMIGQDLSLLSVEELEGRIAQLKEEILRIEAELAGRDATRHAAEALFRRG